MDNTSPTLPFFHYWNRLPNELKTIVLKHLDNNSRLALRACSKGDLNLVNSNRTITIHSIRLRNTDDQWRMFIKKSTYSLVEHSYIYESLDELQQKLSTILKNVEFIHELDIQDSIKFSGALLVAGKTENLHVQRLTCNGNNAVDILSKVRPTYLNYVQINNTYENRTTIYDMPQVLFADEIVILTSAIRDDQLLCLKAREISLTATTNLTTIGIRNFIKKLTQKPEGFRIFRIGRFSSISYNAIMNGLDNVKKLNENQAIINTKNDMYQLDLSYDSEWVTGEIVRSASPNCTEKGPVVETKARIFDCMNLFFDADSVHRLVIHEKNRDIFNINIDSSVDFQKLLENVLEGVVYIKTLVFENETNDWELLSAFGKITVGFLKFDSCDGPSDSLLTNFVDKLETPFLKVVRAFYHKPINNEEVFSTKQLTSAEVIDMPGSYVREDQLFKLNAVHIRVRLFIFSPSVVNRFIKKWLLVLNENDYFFEFVNAEEDLEKNPELIAPEVFDGLDVVSYEKVTDPFSWLGKTVVIVNSPFRDIQFLIQLRTRCIRGQKIEKGQPFGLNGLH